MHHDLLILDHFCFGDIYFVNDFAAAKFAENNFV